MKKMETKSFIFIDTDVFINAMISNSSKEVLERLIERVNDKNTILVLPEVIVKEIKREFESWKDLFFKKAQENLAIKKILGVQDEVTGSNSKQRPAKDLLNVDLIDKLIKDKRDDVLLEIAKFYEGLSIKFESLLKNRNVAVIGLTDKIILNGIRRSLLKKAPCTRLDKTKENAHTKDVDCIAFECLLSLLSTFKIAKNKHTLTLCVKDSDYRQIDRRLNAEICADLKDFNLKDYENIESMLDDSAKSALKLPAIEEGTLTLGATIPMIEGSQITTAQNLSEIK